MGTSEGEESAGGAGCSDKLALTTMIISGICMYYILLKVMGYVQVNRLSMR